MSLRVRAATAADDAALRELLRETPLPGAVSLTLEREPSFFESEVDSLRHDVAFVTQGDELVACGSRILKRAWWQGGESDVAYLADLRVHPGHQRRGGWALRAGYQHLEKMALLHPSAVTWTVVFEDNQIARNILVGREGGLPNYVDRGRLLCPVMLIPKREKWPRIPEGISVEQGVVNWQEIADFLNERYRDRPLAPVHRAEDFAEGKRWPGLQARDWILVRRGRQLVGCVAVWDLRATRQARLRAYRGWLRHARWPLKLLAGLLGRPPLPAPGSILSMAQVSFLAAEGDDVKLATLLLRGARVLAAQRGLHFLCACLHERDPLVPALQGFPAIASNGRLYEVISTGKQTAWVEGVPHIESGGL